VSLDHPFGGAEIEGDLLVQLAKLIIPASRTLLKGAKTFKRFAPKLIRIGLPFRMECEEYLSKLLAQCGIVENRTSFDDCRTKQVIEHFVDHLQGFRPINVP
jgi:hypothetical protein